LYDKIYRADILRHAYALVCANKGSAGIDGITFKAIEEKEGVTAYLAELEEALKSKTYKPPCVRIAVVSTCDTLAQTRGQKRERYDPLCSATIILSGRRQLTWPVECPFR